MSKDYLIVTYDEDTYPSWRGATDKGRGIVFIHSKKEYYLAMGAQTDTLNEAIYLASEYTRNRRKEYVNYKKKSSR